MTSFFSEDIKLMTQQVSQAFEYIQVAPKERSKLLRSSSLPYCPLKEIYEVLAFQAEEGTLPETVDESNLSMLSYVSMGTIIHTIFQNWLPQYFDKINVIGKWNAKEIGCDNANCPCLSDRPILALNEDGCPTCGKHPPYEELEFYGKFTSHIDKIYNIRGTKRVYIVDIKTTSLKAVWAQKAGRGWLPQKSYIFQTDSYLVTSEKLLTAMGYQVCGSLILYVPRDDPSQFLFVPVRNNVTPKLIESIRQRLFKVSDGWRIVSKALKTETIDESTLKACYKHRLCDDEDYYHDHVHDKYKPCPLHKVCFNKKKLQKTLKALL